MTRCVYKCDIFSVTLRENPLRSQMQNSMWITKINRGHLLYEILARMSTNVFFPIQTLVNSNHCNITPPHAERPESHFT